MDKNLVISIKTIIYTALIAVGIYLIYRLGAIIGYLLVALLITISLERAVQFFTNQTFFNRQLGRPVGVLITYFLVFLVASMAITVGLDPLITQSQKLVTTLSQHQEFLTFGGNMQYSLSDVIDSFVSTSGGVFSATRSLFNNITAILSILILSVYLSLDWLNLKEMFVKLFPDKEEDKIRKMLVEIEANVGLWLKGQLILMLTIGIISYIALVIIGVEFPLALAIISGLFEVVPIIGPIISAIIAALVAVIDSPIKALLVIAVFTFIQQLEGNVIVPKVMQQVTGFSPIIILVALLIGSNLFGMLGAVIALPVLMVGVIIVKSISQHV